VKTNSHLTMTCVRMKLGDLDESGRPRPVVMEGSEFDTEFDTILMAIGQTPQIPERMQVARNRNGTLTVDSDTLATGIAGVFAAGDAVSGPASIIAAIAAGRQAAISIDKYLGGKSQLSENLAPSEEKPEHYKAEEGGDEKRPDMPELSVSRRLKSFDVAELGYSAEAAAREAGRCLRCDLEED
jgi:NADPH-dependent glutamate synthase beta subunit-like oxidoreductase